MAMTIAVIMIGTWSDMPMAVITESRENTTSSRRIWTMTVPNAARPLPPPDSCSPPSTFS